MVYDYLFYKSYQLAKKSGNFEGTPVFGGIWGILLCVLFNIASVVFFIDGLIRTNITETTTFISNAKYVFGILVFLLLLWYYGYKGRLQKIVRHYEAKEATANWKVNPIVAMIGAYIISFVILLVSGMYRNGDLFEI